MSRSNKKKQTPPPRPPPPNFSKFKSLSSNNLANQSRPIDLIDWSPPPSPNTNQQRTFQFGGSVSSSYNSSASSLASSKKSSDSSNDFNFSLILNWTGAPPATMQAPPPAQPSLRRAPPVPQPAPSPMAPRDGGARPRIIRPAAPRQPQQAPKQTPQGSPPMPACPPPPAPPNCDRRIDTPYGIALYDFPAKEPGDLAFETDDVVLIMRRINNEWLYGSVMDKEGMFPEKFIRIVVPLPNELPMLTALYEFNTNVPGDLKLVPGQKIRVIHNVNDGWSFGESNGETGTFPRKFAC